MRNKFSHFLLFIFLIELFAVACKARNSNKLKDYGYLDPNQISITETVDDIAAARNLSEEDKKKLRRILVKLISNTFGIIRDEDGVISGTGFFIGKSKFI